MSDKPKVRIREPDHRQLTLRVDDPGKTLAEDHPARMLFEVVKTLDLSGFTKDAKAVEGRAGRKVLSPAMKLTLWLYAISIGVGSAREIERLTKSEDAFKWLTRGLSLTHHVLSRFRVSHGEALQQLMVEVLAVLLHKDLLSLERVAQDGTRVRASASAPSFRRLGSLEACREQAELHLKAVLAEAESAEHRAAQAAKVAKARDFKSRVDEAIATVKELQLKKKPGEQARASTTDPQARVMKMPDGGFRPGYNFQFAVAGKETGGPRTIVGVRVTNLGSDMGSVTPLLHTTVANTGLFPRLWLADANHAKHACIQYADRLGVAVLIPVPEYEQQSSKTVSEAVRIWRDRMSTPEGKRLYRGRASLAELVNASAKRRSALDHVLVRGLEKVTCVALLFSLSFNLTQHARSLLA